MEFMGNWSEENLDPYKFSLGRVENSIGR